MINFHSLLFFLLFFGSKLQTPKNMHQGTSTSLLAQTGTINIYHKSPSKHLIQRASILNLGY
uniref:Uncharacterized protein n=1 Tax=Rhizophora mucronata TaxID=61149 RepID=A0A2P2Q8B8_RHIMU